jgi:hypothetical protein
MKREVRKEVRLQAFTLSLAQLEVLWVRILAVFDSKADLRRTIKFALPGEKLEFESSTEVQQYSSLRGRITDFSLSVEGGGRSVTVRSGGLFSSVPSLVVEGESDIWCAGAAEAVLAVVRTNRVWYFWFVRLPLTLIFFALSLAPTAASWLFPKAPHMSPGLAASWFLTVMLFGYLSFFKDKLLPSASVVITQELGFVRRYGAEIGLILGVISLVVSVLMWLFPIGT